MNQSRRSALVDQIGPESSLPPRERLLETARRLFYTEGIRAVGVDRLVAEASVTKATFYRHFPTKDDLVVDCLRTEHARLMEQTVLRTKGLAPGPAIEAIFVAASERLREQHYTGCPFMRAAAEYPDAAHPARHAVAEHRAWLHDMFSAQLARIGGDDAELAPEALMMLFDGAMAAGYLDDPTAVPAVWRGALRSLLTHR